MLFWAIVFISLALALFAVELFIPSGGLIGFAAITSLIGGLVCLFWFDHRAGLIGTIIVLLVAPFAVISGLNLFPRTPIGKWLTMREAQTAGTTKYDAVRDQDADQLLGQQGKAMTDLHPAGICEINGQRIGCLAESKMILKGSTIEVIRVSGMEITVRNVT